MKYNKHLLFIAVILSLASCKKDDATPPATVNEYTQLKPGNYWVYKHYLIDSAGNAQPGAIGFPGAVRYDSVFIEKDTPINGITYHKEVEVIYSGGTKTSYLRDSLQYLVNNAGTILFSSTDFTNVFASKFLDPTQFSTDSALSYTIKMGEKDKIIAVPAGSFSTVALIINWTFFPFAAQHKQVSNRAQYLRYAKGIGKVSETMSFYVGDPNYTERRLVRYHVQ